MCFCARVRNQARKKYVSYHPNVLMEMVVHPVLTGCATTATRAWPILPILKKHAGDGGGNAMRAVPDRKSVV